MGAPNGNGNDYRWRWIITAATVVVTGGGLGAIGGYVPTQDVRRQLDEVRSEARMERDRVRIEANQARAELLNDLRREIGTMYQRYERLESELDGKVEESMRQEMLANLRTMIAKLDERLDRIERALFIVAPSRDVR